MQNDKMFYGVDYNTKQDKVIIYIGEMKKLIKQGIDLKNIMDDRKKAKVTGLNIRYKYLRKMAKESGGIEIEALNQKVKDEAQEGEITKIIEYLEI